MDSTIHSEDCLAEAAHFQMHRDETIQAWPKICQKCCGGGLFSDPGFFDFVRGYGEPPSIEACSDCFAQGLCPRCRAFLADDIMPFLPWQDGQEGCPSCDYFIDGEPLMPANEGSICDCWITDGEDDGMSMSEEYEYENRDGEPPY